jgi:phytoene dehydrogenase-like protein
VGSSEALPARADVVVVGAGHNGLVAATLLARAGLTVVVVERDSVVGGAARTETPFPKVPGLRQSTGAYLLGLMPPELEQLLDLRLPLVRRDPHYFLPTTTRSDAGGRYLLMGSDREATRRQFVEFFSAADRDADDRLQAELDDLREDLAPAWLQPPGSVEETAERFIRPELRDVFVDLVRGDVASYLDRFGFASELVVAMYAVTDGLSGLHAGPDTPGSGHNFLVHNMCRLPQADGTWMIVEGGMGTVTQTIARRAAEAGATIVTGAPVGQVVVSGGAVTGVVLRDGRSVDATTVVAGCDPYTLADLAPLPQPLLDHLDEIRRPGTTLKVNLALRDLPSFACLPAGAPSPFGSTIHLLPQDQPMAAVRAMWADVQAGRLPQFPTIEWYLHTTADPSLRDDGGHHSSALFVQSVPYDIAGSTWAAELSSYVEKMLAICDLFAPGTSDLVADTFPLPPPGIESHFGIRGGHIHHIDNGVALDARMPYATGVDGLYAASAGCHPAGSVIGAAGHNAARQVLDDHGVAWAP